MADQHSTSPAEVQKFLKGVDYPASKRDLVRKAQQNNAPSDVVNEIQRLPDDNFTTPADVMRAYGEAH